MRLVAPFAISFFIRAVTVGAGSRLVALLTKRTEPPIEKVLLIRSVRIVAGRALSTDCGSMGDSHVQLGLKIFMAYQTQVGLCRSQRDTSGARMACIARAIRERRVRI